MMDVRTRGALYLTALNRVSLRPSTRPPRLSSPVLQLLIKNFMKSQDSTLGARVLACRLRDVISSLCRATSLDDDSLS